MKGITGRTSGISGLLGRIAAAAVTAAAVVVGLMFSVVIFAVAIGVAIVVFGWLWWKTRRVIRQAQREAGERPPPGQGGGTVIEGEVLDAEWKDAKDQAADPRRPRG